MNKLKSHKTVEQIARKHRLDVSFVKRQLEMGIPIEHEHTKDKDLANDIALQHLDEIPDYYTRLKKMEASAKKNHKKFKDVIPEKESVIELEKRLVKLSDISYDSIDKLMRVIMKKYDMTAKELHNAFVKKHGKKPDDWVKEKLNEGLLDWFQSKSKDRKRGWVDVVDGDACAREEGETATPKCVSSEKRASMSREERIAAQAAKRREDPNQPQKSNAAKPTMVQTDRKTRKEEMDLQEVKDKPGKGSGKKDACYSKVKSRYDVWPSAYASGALVKCRKVGAKNWGTKSEEIAIDEGQKCWSGYKKKGTKKMFGKTYNNCVKIDEAMGVMRYCPKCQKDETRNECKYGVKYWDMFSVPVSLASNAYDPNTPHPGNMPESYDHEHSMARSEISTIIAAAKRLKKKMKGEGNIEAWVQSKITKAADYLDSAADYIDSGEMKAEEYSNWRGDFGLSEDWQKVNRNDRTPGMSKKAVKAFRSENPGSKLKTAVTGDPKPGSADAKRRSSYCSRSEGQMNMHNIDCSDDPDKAICKARRRWKCK